MNDKGLFERIKSLPGFFNSVIALVVTIVVGAVGAINYFATRGQLDTLKCVFETDINALSYQVLNGAHETRFSELRNELLLIEQALKNDPSNTQLRLRHRELEERRAKERADQRANDHEIEVLKKKRDECYGL